MRKCNSKMFAYTLGAVLLGVTAITLPVNAASKFNPEYYGATYPDVVAVLGTEPEVLLNHYITYGMKEGRYPYEGAKPGAAIDGVSSTPTNDVNVASEFDSQYYAAAYPDVVAVLGTNPKDLLNHYLTYGIKEGRYPYAGANPGTVVNGISNVSANVANPALKFDPQYYANTYPDVVAALGTNQEALLNHYLTYGMKEGRYPYEGAVPGAAINGMLNVSVDITKESQFVPANRLANLSSLRKKMTDDELNQAYNVALQIVTPYAELSREEQLQGIAYSLRSLFDSGMTYSMSASHYNDPYGYFVLGTASCAGCARATGLCLNILGIPYEHINENQYSHQWCRVEVNGTYWICDAYGLYCGPEPAPYEHPYL